MTLHRFLLSAVTVFTIVAGLIGSQTVAHAQAGPPEIYNRVAPYVDESVWLIGHADLSTVDPTLIRKWIEDRLIRFQQLDQAQNQGKGQQHFQEIQRGLGMPVMMAQGWLDQVKKAGGRHVYLIVTNQNVKDERPPVFVFPIEPNGDGQALAQAIFPMRGNRGRPNPRMPVAEQVGNVVFFGEPESVERLKHVKPVDRPVLREAFAAVAGANVGAAAEMNEELVKIAVQEEPTLPREFGKQDTAQVLGDIKWGHASIQLPPNLSVMGVVQAANPDSARRLEGIGRTGIEIFLKEIGIGEDQALLRLLAPQVQGDRLTVSLTDDQIQNQLAPGLATGIIRAREQAMRVQSASQMRQLVLVAMMFARDRQGEYPADMLALIGQNPQMQRFQRNPQRPEREVGYIYIKPATAVAKVNNKTGEHIVLYEDHDKFNDGINVAYLDGHVEFTKDEARFKQQLADTKKRNTELEEGL